MIIKFFPLLIQKASRRVIAEKGKLFLKIYMQVCSQDYNNNNGR